MKKANNLFDRDKMVKNSDSTFISFRRFYLNVHKEAEKMGITNSVASCTYNILKNRAWKFTFHRGVNWIQITTEEDLQNF